MAARWRILRKIGVGLLVGSASVWLLLRLSVPWLEQQAAPLSTWLSAHWQAQVQIARIQATWSTWGPKVQLQDVHIGMGAHRIQIAQISADFSVAGLKLQFQQPHLLLALSDSMSGSMPQLGYEPVGVTHWIHQLSVQDARVSWSDSTLPSLNVTHLDAVRTADAVQVVAQIEQTANPIHVQLRITPTLTAGHVQWPDLSPEPLTVEYQATTAGARWRLHTTTLALDAVQPVLMQLPIPAVWRTHLAQLQPTGRLQNVQFDWCMEPSPTWAFESNFKDLTIKSQPSWPQLTGLQGRIQLQPTEFTADLQVHDTTLDYPAWFRAPVPITQLTAQVQGERTAEGTWQIRAPSIQLQTPDFSTEGQVQLTLLPQQSPHLEVQARLVQGKLDRVKSYLPARQMSPKLVRWLDRALVSGQIVQSDITLRGPLDQFPYDQHSSGMFQVRTHIQQGVLHYHPDWPPLQIGRLQLDFNRNSFNAQLLAGTLLGSQVSTVAKIAQLSRSSPLELHLQSQGPFQDLLSLLQAPTLNNNIRQIAQQMQATGTAQSQLQLQIPLVTGEQATQVDGEVQLTDAGLQLEAVQLEQIQGTLAIRENRVQAEAVQAQIRGQAMRIAIEPDAAQTLIRLHTQLNRTSIARWLPAFPAHRLRGTAMVHIQLPIPLQRTGEHLFSQLHIESDLRGLQIRLPAPLGKSKRTARALRLQLALGDNHAPHRLQYGRRWHGVLSQDGQRGTLGYALPSAALNLPEVGYRLQGDFGDLDLQAWHAVWNTLPNRPSQTPWQLDMTAATLQYAPFSLEQVQIKGRRSAQHIRGEITSPRISGHMEYDQTRSQPRLKLYFNHADFSWPLAQNAKKTRPDIKINATHTWPDVRLLCEKLRVNKTLLGQLFLDTRADATGYVLNNLRLLGDNLQLQAQGDWQPTSKTLVRGAYNIQDLGQLLGQLGYTQQLHDAPTAGTFDLHWPGHPLQATSANLAGRANLAIGPGRLAELSPGITRVLSILNVDAFNRRLKLDFADLFAQGYTFDRIQGDFSFNQGQAYTRNLEIDGPTSRIQFGGRIGLVDQDFEQLVYITPKLDGALLLAGTLAGGPVGTLTSLLVQQILRREVNRFSRFEYSVTGTWQAPKVVALESGGALSDFINKLRQEQTQRKTPAQQDQIDKQPTPGVLQRILDVFKDVFRPTPMEQGWTDTELLDIE